jgi:hypothetical protein
MQRKKQLRRERSSTRTNTTSIRLMERGYAHTSLNDLTVESLLKKTPESI